MSRRQDMPACATSTFHIIVLIYALIWWSTGNESAAAGREGDRQHLTQYPKAKHDFDAVALRGSVCDNGSSSVTCAGQAITFMRLLCQDRQSIDAQQGS